jgi:hypothetical protein
MYFSARSILDCKVRKSLLPINDLDGFFWFSL